MTVPVNLFVIGVPKAGTTYVHATLDELPGVDMSVVKEPGYFHTHRIYARGAAYYERTFFRRGAGSAPWTGEATPWYFYSETALQRVLADAPSDAKIIVCLRDPAERAISMYFDQVRAGYESRSIDVALDPQGEEPVRLEQRYISCGEYLPYLRQWVAAFGRDRVLILDSTEVRHSGNLVRRLQTFLDLPPSDLPAEVALESNVGGRSRSKLAAAALRRIQESEGRWKDIVRAVAPEAALRRVAQRLVRMNRSTSRRPSTPIPDQVRQRLERHYATSVGELEAFLGTDLGHWPSRTMNHVDDRPDR